MRFCGSQKVDRKYFEFYNWSGKVQLGFAKTERRTQQYSIVETARQIVVRNVQNLQKHNQRKFASYRKQSSSYCGCEMEIRTNVKGEIENLQNLL